MTENLSSKHHAPWRIEFSRIRGSLSPRIYESKALDSMKIHSPQRLIISACDYEFFEKNFHYIINYERSSCQIIYALGVFSSKEESRLTAQKLYKFRDKYNLQKFLPFVFGNPSLEWILSQQKDAEIQWDYKINYIRSSRYNLVKPVWKSLGISMRTDCSIRESSTYIIDFDSEIRADVNQIIKRKYPDLSLILSWDSKISPCPDFTKTLSSCAFNGTSIEINQPYKIVKAGFTAIAPSTAGNLFLTLFAAYSIGDDNTFFYMRLFSFYFSDQVAIFLAIREIYLNEKYRQQVAWLDMSMSDIVNLDSALAKYIWCPKGKNVINR
jgi:hypothetical protein